MTLKKRKLKNCCSRNKLTRKKIEENYSVQDKQDALAMCALQISAKKKQSIISDNELMNELENKIDSINNLFDKK